MIINNESKVTPEHLRRLAYLYVRQSTLRQVLENTESTERQYALRRRAVTLGWPEDRIVVIDHDQGQSGASAREREGFQKLVVEVGLGKAGLVMGLEVSRLARNCADWHQLLEICALTHCLILDEEGVYDPGHFNDRLLLGLKGTMSEAELHVLKARLMGGALNKAQRAELKIPLPVGLVYDEDQKVILDPDQQVQQALRLFFETFERTGSAWSTVRYFHQENLSFPRHGKAGTGELVWQQLTYGIALDTLHNPRYAGAFCFGRTRIWKDGEGKIHCRELPREEWRFLIKDAHSGYISWDQYQAHQDRLLTNHPGRHQAERKAGAPREGPALLQGVVLCGKCGRSMSVRYHHRGGQLVPEYVCQKQCIERAQALCQQIPGSGIDEAVGQLLVQSLSPMALEVALEVQKEIQERVSEAERLRQQQVQRAQYEADRARLRYLRVDPNHRLVADTLEAQWNEKLRLLAQAKEECEEKRRLDSAQVTDEQKAKIRTLATDFPRLWQDPKTENRERKRMVRLLLEDVTLRREQEILVQVRFKGGATRELRLPLPKRSWETQMTPPEVLLEMDRLLENHTEAQVAALLNERGWSSGTGLAFSSHIITSLCQDHQLKSHYQRLREKGWLTNEEIAQIIGVVPNAVNYWRKAGILIGVRYNEKAEHLFAAPPPHLIQEIQRRRQLRASKAKASKPRPQSTPRGVV